VRGAGVPGAPEEGAGGGLRHVCGARGPLWQPGRAVLCEYHAATYVMLQGLLSFLSPTLSCLVGERKTGRASDVFLNTFLCCV
jgi:hypothetical protein